ncbi:MAG: hypothetical protein RID09_28855 [Coleofasciculus sp. G1-WW12-02]
MGWLILISDRVLNRIRALALTTNYERFPLPPEHRLTIQLRLMADENTLSLG